jgi:hypothetical protein
MEEFNLMDVSLGELIKKFAEAIDDGLILVLEDDRYIQFTESFILFSIGKINELRDKEGFQEESLDDMTDKFIEELSKLVKIYTDVDIQT